MTQCVTCWFRIRRQRIYGAIWRIQHDVALWNSFWSYSTMRYLDFYMILCYISRKIHVAYYHCIGKLIYSWLSYGISWHKNGNLLTKTCTPCMIGKQKIHIHSDRLESYSLHPFLEWMNMISNISRVTFENSIGIHIVTIIISVCYDTLATKHLRISNRHDVECDDFKLHTILCWPFTTHCWQYSTFIWDSYLASINWFHHNLTILKLRSIDR